MEFGITDCFDASVRLIARNFEWSEHAMLQISMTHFRANGQDLNANRTKQPQLDLKIICICYVRFRNV